MISLGNGTDNALLLGVLSIGRTIGKRAAELLKTRPTWGQKQMADAIGVSQATVSALISGQTKDPGVSIVLGLSSVFGVGLGYVLGLTDDQTLGAPLPSVSEMESRSLEDHVTALQRRFDELAAHVGFASEEAKAEKARGKAERRGKKRTA